MPLSQLRFSWIALLTLTFLAILFFWRLFTPSELDRQLIVQNQEFVAFYYANAAYQAERIADGSFPLWNPYDHVGDPFFANLETAPFYPLRLLIMWIAGENWDLQTYQFEIALHYWLASLMMYLWLRLIVQRPTAALIGAILFAYGGYLTGYPMLQVNILASHIWLPLILIGIHLSVTRNGWVIWGGAISGIGVALSLLGGFPQTTMQITYLSLAYLAYLGWQQRLAGWTILARMALFGVIGAGLSAIQLIPTAELIPQTARVLEQGFFAKGNGYTPSFLLQTLYPEAFGFPAYYVSIIGLILAIGAVLARRGPFWIGMIAIGVLLSLGGNTIVYDFFYVFIPGFSVFRGQERIASVVSFAVVMLATLQVDALLQGAILPRFRLLIYGAAGLLGAVFCFGGAILLLQGDSTLGNAALQGFGFAAFMAGLAAIGYAYRGELDRNGWLGVALIVLTVIDLFTIGTRSYNFVRDLPENRVQPIESIAAWGQREIAWRVDGAAGVIGYGIYYRIPDLYGISGFSRQAIKDLLTLPVDRFWEVFAVRYITTHDQPPDIPLQILAYDRNHLAEEFVIYEILNPRPFAHLVYDARIAENNPIFARQMMSDTRVDLREMLITIDPLPTDLHLPVTRPELSVIRDYQMPTPERVTLTVSTESDAMLTVAIPNYPGWQAWVNGVETPILDAYAGLIAIPMRAGVDQAVVIEFRPRSLVIGAGITAITALLTLIACGIATRSRSSARISERTS
jgi:hypothetical protein